jgi:uncharacterized protein YggE
MSIKTITRAGAFAALLAAPLGVAAQTADHADKAPYITVLGDGEITQPADSAAITGEVRADAKDQEGALRAMSAKRDAIEVGLNRLAGAKSIKVDTGDIAFTPILPPNCRGEYGNGDDSVGPPGKCTPIGIEGTLKLTATVRPIDALGSLASLAVQLGLSNVSLGASGVDDPVGVQARATRIAFTDARAQAELLAAASGQHVGRVLRINLGGPEPRNPDDKFQITNEAVKVDMLKPAPPPPPPMTPDIALQLTPPKIQISSSVIVEFELVK